MRTTRFLAVSAASAVAVTALGLAAPTAVARDGVNVNPSNIVALPSVIARGGQLTVTVDGCPRGGTMSSDAFPTTTLTPISGAHHTSRGTATVSNNATPGTHSITVRCDGRTLTNPAAFTVIGGVRGGLGGSTSSGATPTDIAIGGGLVAAAVIGGGVFWMRRRAERRA
ncbi:hypothetical protein [Streptomyces sp. A012304]|uniref:hypothetical protein n=1 Tax=Streptomyces sp. A012304 TaxID=375446 RepID=UPI002230BAB7|nr:hypothetical protein [Streptomyces sp. A012304]GKQ39739.1 hypothetical protein ALMP_62660 [Streptomyces sp. A012304]